MRDVAEPVPAQAGGEVSVATGGQGARRPDAVDVLWRAFRSLKLALFLILAISAASVAGALLMQVPGSLTPAEYAQWLDRLRPRYGAFADIFSALGLLNVFGIWWFRLLLGLLSLSVIICTLDRWPRTWRAIRQPNIRPQDALFARAANRATFGERGITTGEAASAIEGVLRARGYRVRREDESGDQAHLYADRNWFGRLGTYLNHLALVLILAGAVVGGVFGFRDREFMVAEGSTRAVGHDTTLSLKVESFADEYYPEGPPKDFRSEVVLYDKGVEVKRGTIRVNEPLEYEGIRFYQSFFGPAVILQVKTLDGKLVYDDGIPLAWRTTTGDRPIGSITLPGQNLNVDVVAPSSANREPDPLIPAGQVRVQVYRSGASRGEATELLSLGQPKQIGNLEYTFVRERQFTGLQVVRDPSALIIWVASALMVLGLMLVFYFPHRRLWARCEVGPDGLAMVRLAAPSSRAFSFAREFRELAEACQGELETARREDAAATPV